MKKGFTSIVLTIVLILGCMVFNTNGNINTVNADLYNIEISVETKEISIEEIPQDRTIEVEVYVNNVPNEDFYVFNAAFKLDHRLEKWIDYALGVKAISSLSLTAATENNCLYFESDTIIHSNKKIENGRIFNIELILPLEASEGDFYEINPISDCGNGLDYTSFILQSNTEKEYGPTNFSFVGGGIQIRSSQPEQPNSKDPVPPTNNDNLNPNNKVSDIQFQIIDESKEVTTIPVMSSANASTPFATTISSTNSTSKVTFVTSTEQKISETDIDTNTEPINTTEKKEDNNKTSNIKLFFLVIIILLIISILLIITIRKRKKK